MRQGRWVGARAPPVRRSVYLTPTGAVLPNGSIRCHVRTYRQPASSRLTHSHSQHTLASASSAATASL
eukprot:scaffold3987_cov118-Isochrysis_galbana.AAC.3